MMVELEVPKNQYIIGFTKLQIDESAKILKVSTKTIERTLTSLVKNNFLVRVARGNYLVNPNVYVHVVEYRPFYIHGEVNRPGGYPYQPGLTVNQAIALAGGLTERASKDKIYLFKEKSKKTQTSASLTYIVNAGDTILIKQRFF